MSFVRNTLLASLVLVLCAVFVMPTLAQDQSSARGNLSGLVYDSSQSLVPGAEVTITGPIGSLTQNTSGQGSFTPSECRRQDSRCQRLGKLRF